MLFHPGVAEAAVVAMPDPKWGERPCMFVVPRQARELDATDLREFLARNFPSWWLPDRFDFVDALPKTSVGKLDKKRCAGRLVVERRD